MLKSTEQKYCYRSKENQIMLQIMQKSECLKTCPVKYCLSMRRFHLPYYNHIPCLNLELNYFEHHSM